MKDLLIWLLVIVIIVGATIGLFVQFAPSNVGYSYWLVLADISIIEILIGAYMIYTHAIGSRRHKTNFPIAMNISIFTLFIIFSAIGILLDIVLLAISISDVVLLWLIIVRWVLLLAITTPMWFTGKTGTEKKALSEISRKRRGNITSDIDLALSNLRNLQVSPEDQSLWRKTIDEVETIRNKIRSRASDPKMRRDNEDTLENLVDELVKVTTPPSLSSNEVINQIRSVTPKITRELS